MEAKAKALEPAAIVAKLQALEDIVRTRYAAGQVLCYRDHYPVGLFVVLSGTIALGPHKKKCEKCRSRIEAGRAFILPAYADLQAKACCTIRAATDVEVLVIMRSQFEHDVKLLSLMNQLLALECPLRRKEARRAVGSAGGSGKCC